MTMPPYKVCVVGVGFVGLTLALSLTKRGISVVALEKDADVVDELRNKIARFDEPNLPSLLNDAVSSGLIQILATTDNLESLNNCNVFVLTVGTPLTKGEINLEFLELATQAISPYVMTGDLVILRSTVRVGTTKDLVKKILDRSSFNYFLAMCPERTMEGFALEEMSSIPQIVGGINIDSTNLASEFFEALGAKIVKVRDSDTAEMVKLVNNTYRDLMFGFANEVAGICNEMAINPLEVINSANENYPRSNIALPGLTGGPCLEKDPWILVESAKSRSKLAPISTASRLVNEGVLESFISKLLVSPSGHVKVCILGLSFKGTPPIRDTRGGFVLPLLDILDRKGFAYKAVGFEPAGEVLIKHENFMTSSNIEDAISGASLIVILTNAQEFRLVGEKIAQLANSEATVIDYWGMLDKNDIAAEQHYFSYPGERV
jgi:UDP-N-acetyl-D-mannosaminuronic acid dehydrogenase